MKISEDLFEQLGKSKFFSEIDFSKGFWQISVAEEDVSKTAFVTPDGAYEFLRIPFGMKNFGATLICRMREVVVGDHLEVVIAICVTTCYCQEEGSRQ